MRIPPAVLELRRFCDEDEGLGRYAMSAVLISRPSADDPQCIAVATDGRRLVRLSWHDDTSAGVPARSMLVPAHVLAIIAFGLKKVVSLPRGEFVRWPEAPTDVGVESLTFGGMELSFAPVEGRFPNFEQIFNELPKVAGEVRLDHDFVRDAMLIARSFGDEFGDEYDRGVDVRFPSDSRDMVVFERQEEDVRMEAAIMPIRKE